MLPARKKVRYFEEKPSKKKTDDQVNSNEKTEAKPIKKIKLEDFQKTLGDKKGFLKNSGKKQKHFKNETGSALSKKVKSKIWNKDKKSNESKVEKQTKLCEMKWKDRKQERKKLENKVFEISVKAKSIWEVVRREDCSKEKKEQLFKELMTLIRGHVKQLIFAHDTARVIETIVALGTEEHRTALFEELKSDIVVMARSKYAKFFLIKVLNYGTKPQKDFIIKTLEGNIVSLVKHTEAASVVESAYNEYANFKQRAAMVQEFYGLSFKFFKDTTCNSLSELIEKDPSKKEEIMNFMKTTLLRILEKSVIRHSIVHHVLREFMEHSDESGRTEVIQALRTGLVEILHSKDGSRVAMMCIWNGSSKDRKIMVKGFKTHVVKIAKEEQGHLVLLSVLDSLDDVKLVEKVVVQELIRGCLELSDDQFGRKVLMYLMSPRDGRYFHPDVVNILKRGDNNLHSKKDATVRREELRYCASTELLKFVSQNVKHLLATNPKCILLLSILKNASGDTTGAFNSLVDLLKEPYHPPNEDGVHIIEHVGLSFVFKKLLKESSKEKNDNAQLFASLLLEKIDTAVLRTWIECNRGSFLLLNLLETNISSVVKRLKKELCSDMKLLAKKNFRGAELLLKNLSDN